MYTFIIRHVHHKKELKKLAKVNFWQKLGIIAKIVKYSVSFTKIIHVKKLFLYNCVVIDKKEEQKLYSSIDQDKLQWISGQWIEYRKYILSLIKIKEITQKQDLYEILKINMMRQAYGKSLWVESRHSCDNIFKLFLIKPQPKIIKRKW